MTFNPFLEPSELEYQLPPFERIRDEHYLPGFYAGIAAQKAEIDFINSQPEVTFENTIVALEKSGQILTRVANVFYNKSSSDTSDVIDAIEAEIAPKLAAHADSIKLDPTLFSRIKTLVSKSSALNPEDSWVLKKYYEDFLQAGADLDPEKRERVKEINEELSTLETKFAKNLLADTNDLAVMVDDEKELEGLSPHQIAACKAAAEARGHADKWLIGMVNFSGHPLLGSLSNRALREEIMKNSLRKGARANANDTRDILLRMIELRLERAKLFGMKSHAEYVLSQQTAGSANNVHSMLKKLHLLLHPMQKKRAKIS